MNDPPAGGGAASLELEHAATFAGTVSPAVASELGKVVPSLMVGSTPAMTPPVGIPGRPTPAGASEWLADLIEYASAQYAFPAAATERMKWFIARVMAASALPDARQTAIRDGLFQKKRKGGAR